MLLSNQKINDYLFIKFKIQDNKRHYSCTSNTWFSQLVIYFINFKNKQKLTNREKVSIKRCPTAFLGLKLHNVAVWSLKFFVGHHHIHLVFAVRDEVH